MSTANSTVSRLGAAAVGVLATGVAMLIAVFMLGSVTEASTPTSGGSGSQAVSLAVTTTKPKATTTTTKPKATTTTTKPKATTTTTKPTTTTTTTKPTTTTTSSTTTTTSASTTTTQAAATTTTQAADTTTAPPTAGSGSGSGGSGSSGATASSGSLAFTGPSQTLNVLALAGGALVLLGLLMLTMLDAPRRVLHRLASLVRRG